MLSLLLSLLLMYLQEKIDEVRKDNAALLKRIRLSQSPMPMKKRAHPSTSGENLPPTLDENVNFVSPDGQGIKRKRVERADLDSSLDLFGSPGEWASSDSSFSEIGY